MWVSGLILLEGGSLTFRICGGDMDSGSGSIYIYIYYVYADIITGG